jgi:hypothetical protein
MTVCLGDPISENIDIEKMIVMFAKYKRIKKEDMPEFRATIMRGLDKMGLGNKAIDLDKYKKVVRDRGDNL